MENTEKEFLKQPLILDDIFNLNTNPIKEKQKSLFTKPNIILSIGLTATLLSLHALLPNSIFSYVFNTTCYLAAIIAAMYGATKILDSNKKYTEAYIPPNRRVSILKPISAFLLSLSLIALPHMGSNTHNKNIIEYNKTINQNLNIQKNETLNKKITPELKPLFSENKMENSTYLQQMTDALAQLN
jgi:hypothetical protein